MKCKVAQCKPEVKTGKYIDANVKQNTSLLSRNSFSHLENTNKRFTTLVLNSSDRLLLRRWGGHSTCTLHSVSRETERMKWGLSYQRCFIPPFILWCDLQSSKQHCFEKGLYPKCFPLHCESQNVKQQLLISNIQACTVKSGTVTAQE